MYAFKRYKNYRFCFENKVGRYNLDLELRVRTCDALEYNFSYILDQFQIVAFLDALFELLLKHFQNLQNQMKPQ